MSTNRTHTDDERQSRTARLPLRLSEQLLADVTAHARTRGEDRSAFVRRAIRQAIASDRVQDYRAAAKRAFADRVFEPEED